MTQNKNNESLKTLLLRLGIMLLCFQLARVIFLIANWANFPTVSLNDFFVSIWFDVITISLLGFPFICLSILPFKFVYSKIYQFFLKIIFHTTNGILLALNLMDVVYFSFTQKRTTIDLLSIVSAGNDFAQQIGSFFRDFWSLLIFFAVLFALSIYLQKKIVFTYQRFSFLKRIFILVITISVFIFLGRGGFRLKPISPIDASTFVRVENAALVLNTPFTMIKSFNQDGIEEKNYFSLEKEKSLFNPIKQSEPQNILPNNTNVVIIMLESFGNEWVGASGATETYTPFLDSLAGESLYFVNGISNGKKSIEAVPSIISSLPSLLDNPYISSHYSTNKLNSLPETLKKSGYETAFFHGATNGSMRFDAFAAQTGFNNYFGRTEYNNDDHFDKTWGILDEYFNPWSAKKMSDLKKPFFATLFTLSSHHPYYIPKHLKGKLKKGPQQICESINYGDYSLRKFFQEAKKQEWYKNTLFVLCADHTSSTNSEVYNQRTEMYKIPILFFDPSGKLEVKKEKRIFQHIDIMPTIFDLLNIDLTYYSFGNSYFSSNSGEAVTYIEGTYHYFKDKYMITFSGDKTRNLYNIEDVNPSNPDSLKFYRKKATLFENRLKAIIQRYNRDLILNQNTSDEKKN